MIFFMLCILDGQPCYKMGCVHLRTILCSLDVEKETNIQE